MLDKVAAYGLDAVEMTAGGWGHDLKYWKEFFSVCRMQGYNGYVSLEMEDLNRPRREGGACM